MVGDRQSIEDVLERVDEHVQEARDAIAESMKGKPLGGEPATDAEFVAFFDEQAAKNHNWVLALGYVEGGLEHIARYERLRMRGPQ